MNPDKSISLFPKNRGGVRAYTLIEALVAGGILMIGIGAAASLSLAFLSQEEISERAARACTAPTNAARVLSPNAADAPLCPMTSMPNVTFDD